MLAPEGCRSNPQGCRSPRTLQFTEDSNEVEFPGVEGLDEGGGGGDEKDDDGE